MGPQPKQTRAVSGMIIWPFMRPSASLRRVLEDGSAEEAEAPPNAAATARLCRADPPVKEWAVAIGESGSPFSRQASRVFGDPP